MTTGVRQTNGLTAYQYLKGREYAKRLTRFAERVQYKLPNAGPRAAEDKLQKQWMFGYVVGFSRVSNDYIILDEERCRIVTAKSVQRIAPEDRWKSETLERMAATPQSLAAPSAPEVVFGPSEPAEQPEERRGRAPRRVDHRNADFDPATGGHGYTVGCPKCDHAVRWG